MDPRAKTRSLSACRMRLARAVVALGLLVGSVASAGVMDGFIDPTDGQFDVSDWLLNKRGVLFNPIIVTEPAVGYGGGGTLMYFHKNKADEERAKEGEVLGMPPSISFAVGLGTENGTWAAGGGHFASWREDTIRYLGGVGYSSMNLDFYVGSLPIGYNLEGIFVIQEANFRIRRTPLFLGARYVYAHFDSRLDVDSGLPPILQDQGQTDNLGGLGINVLWDSRDNLLDPTKGQYFRVAPMFFGPWMGGDDWFQMLAIQLRSFHKVHERVHVNGRLDTDLSFGDTPFYALPRINLRGVSATRYQGIYAGEAEVEGRWNVWKRWSLIGFFGLGWRAGEPDVTGSDDSVVPAGGGGFRYLLARQLGLTTGMDFAGSKNQFAFYFQVGSAWR